MFAHGSGSSRHSPRNRYVAAVLHQADLGTLLFDLLTPDEEADRANVFDIGLLAGLCVPETSSMSCDQPIFVDQASDASPSSDSVLLKIDRLG